MPEASRIIEPEDDALYRQVLDEIKKRIDHAAQHLPSANTWPELESCALQVRMAIELIVMGSLVTNREAIEGINLALSSKNSASDAAKTARKANCDYWPKATHALERPDGPIQLVPTEGALTEANWEREWGRLSALLHAHNPFREHVQFADSKELVTRVASEIVLLMTHHSIHLADRDGMLVGQISPEGVSVTHFGLVRDPASPKG